MKQSIANKLTKISAMALLMESQYLAGRVFKAQETLDKLQEMLETVDEPLRNEELGYEDKAEIAKIFENAEKSPKFGHLPRKNILE